MSAPTPLRRFVSWRMALVTTVPVAIIAVLLWLYLYPLLRSGISSEQDALARSIAREVQAHLLSRERQVRSLADMLGGDLSEGQVRALLDAGCGRGTFFETILLISDTDGVIENLGLPPKSRAKREDLLGIDISGQSFFAEREMESASWSKIFLSTVSSRLAVAVVKPIRGRVLVGEITLENLSGFIDHFPPQDVMRIALVDGLGRVIADSNSRNQGYHLGDVIAALSADGDSEEARSFVWDGTRMLGSSVGIDPIGWNVVVARPHDQVFAPLRTCLALLTGAGLFALLSSFLLSWRVAGGLSRLVNAYADRARAIAGGSYVLDWPSGGPVEFRDLGLSLQTMAATIGEREKQLKASENHIRTTLDSIGDAVISTDTSGLITRLNPTAEALTGWKSGEAIGRGLGDVLHMESVRTGERASGPGNRLFVPGPGADSSSHAMLIARDGRRFQIAESAAPIRDEHGELTGVVLVFRDVTDWYKQERRIRENEARLRRLTDNIPGVVYQFRAVRKQDYINEFVSARALEMFGLEANPETFVECFHACLPEEDREAFLRSVHKVVTEVLPWRYEGRFNRPDGKSIWFSANAVPVQEGEDVIFYGFLTDVTLRRENEDEVRRLRNYLSNIINSMPSMLIAVDGAGNVTQWNNQAELATGLSFEEVHSRSLVLVLPRLSGEMERIRESIRERRVIKSPKIPCETEGGSRFEDITIFPLVANGVDGAVIRVDDVTERVRMEEMVIQSEKMLTVGGLAAGMAHEINNPLAGMMQTAEVMSSRLRTHLDMPANHKAAKEAGTTVDAIEKFMEARGVPRMLDGIVASGQRIAVIVENMLSFARKEDAARTSHDLDRILEKTIALAATDYDLKKKYDFKQIKIERAYAENMPMVPCQETKIQQVILNILTNGVHAMQAARTVNPRFLVRTYLDSSRGMACMEIEDNGPGMDEVTRRHVFDPFFTTKKQGAGTGLGLSVSYFIITKNHGGELDVESQPGAGAKFIIRLPLSGNAAQCAL